MEKNNNNIQHLTLNSIILFCFIQANLIENVNIYFQYHAVNNN